MERTTGLEPATLTLATFRKASLASHHVRDVRSSPLSLPSCRSCPSSSRTVCYEAAARHRTA